MNRTLNRKSSSPPFLSVIMPVYNAAPFLSDAIESILGQTYTRFEFIIVDDQSTDGSRNIIAGYAGKDHRILPVFRDQRGIAGAMNEGVRLARGEWIARMDADNLALPDRFAVQLDWINKNRVDVCGAQAETFGEKEKMLWFPESHDAVCRELLFRCAILYPAAMIRTDVFRNNLYERECVFDDYELFTRLAPCYRMGNVPSVLLRYRKHDQQVSKIRLEEVGKDFQKYRFRYFYKIFPQTPLADYLSLALVSDRQPLNNLPQLEKAGQWLVQLSDVPDKIVRQKMGERWQKTCEISAKLCGNVDSIFEYYRGKIENEKG
jgi:glycosyltransferase involved in cell wall biosynthesis